MNDTSSKQARGVEDRYALFRDRDRERRQGFASARRYMGTAPYNGYFPVASKSVLEKKACAIIAL